ncbi:MAG: BMP family ABC transporter substrate-binding protein, partial [Clostridia bacterium]|nr:BMP family ABC transporter substrate-binding protein [Clostridia bacterium]
MKKFLSVALAVVMVLATLLSFASCSGNADGFKPVDKKDLKIGMITLHDDSSTYDKNFIEAMYRALENLGLSKDQLILYTGIPETEDCYNKAKACANDGCQVVFADSFGHEDFLIQAAQEFSSVRFCHATGTKAHTLGLDNFSNAFASIYEGRYLAGIAAGMKLNEMINAGTIKAEEAVMGYVGAFTYAEVMSGYTSFYLGAKSVCPSVTMKVRFTGSWYDTDKEAAAASALIKDDKCVLISQHADSYGAPNTCEELKVPNVSYNGSTEAQGPNTYIVSSKIDWTPYFEYMINCVIKGEKIDADWVGTIKTGSVKLEAVNAKVAAKGTQEAIDAAKAQLEAGTLNVFDVAKDNFITVDGKKLDSYKADVDYDDKFEHETEVVANGVFAESK